MAYNEESSVVDKRAEILNFELTREVVRIIESGGASIMILPIY
jgi:hypothetical protein